MQSESVPTRNTRRRLADDYPESDRSLPPATQLAKTREAYQSAASNSAYEPGMLRDL